MTKQCSTLSPDFFGSDQYRMDWNRPSSRHVTLPTSPFIAPSCLVLRPPGMAFPSLVLRHRPALKSPPAKISLCLLSKDTLGFQVGLKEITSAYSWTHPPEIALTLPESPSDDDFAKICSLEAVPPFSLPAELSPEDDLSVSGPR